VVGGTFRSEGGRQMIPRRDEPPETAVQADGGFDRIPAGSGTP
jgi:hypothetical protein